MAEPLFLSIEPHFAERWEDLNLPFGILIIVLKWGGEWLTDVSGLFALTASGSAADCCAF